MLRRLFLSLLLFLPFAAAVVAGQEKAFTPDMVPNVHVQSARAYLSDPARLVSAAAADTVNALCRALEQRTGIQAAVVVVPSVADGDLFGFSHELFRLWKIGQKSSDNGFLMVVDASRRRVRFTTGYGLEGPLPDAVCKRIQMRYVKPALVRGDFDAAVTQGMGAVYMSLKDSMRPAKDAENFNPWFAYVFIIAAILLFALLPGWMASRRSRCPRCGKKALRKMSSEIINTPQGRIRRDTYLCGKCGYIHTRDRYIDDDGPGGIGSFLGGMFLGSLLGGGRGGFGGGYDSGGSFGGGDTGGGGAES